MDVFNSQTCIVIKRKWILWKYSKIQKVSTKANNEEEVKGVDENSTTTFSKKIAFQKQH